jgi:hypothetical protein
VNQVFQTIRQQPSPAKAGDPLFQSQPALALAKAFVWATSNGVRECAPNDRLRMLATNGDLLDEMADAAP